MKKPNTPSDEAFLAHALGTQPDGVDPDKLREIGYGYLAHALDGQGTAIRDDDRGLLPQALPDADQGPSRTAAEASSRQGRPTSISVQRVIGSGGLTAATGGNTLPAPGTPEYAAQFRQSVKERADERRTSWH